MPTPKRTRTKPQHPTLRAPESPLAGVEWVGGRVLMPSAGRKPSARRSEAIAWVVEGRPAVVEPAPPGARAGLLAAAMKRALGIPGIPHASSVRTPNAEEVPALRALLGPGVPIEVAPAPELEAVVSRIQETDRAFEQSPAVAELAALAPEIPAEAAAFVRAANAFYQLAPWDLFKGDQDVIQLDAPDLGLDEAIALVVGQAGQSFGVLCFDTLEEFDAFYEASLEAARTRRQPREPMASFRSVSFTPTSTVPALLRNVLAALEPSIVGAPALPELQSSTYEEGFVELDPEDVVVGTAVCEAIARLCAAHGPAIARGESTELDESYTIELGGGRAAKVRVRFPALLDEAPPRAPEDLAVRDFLAAWRPEFESRYGEEVRRASDEVTRAYLGRAPTRKDPRVAPAQTSLPGLWASTFRPMRDGRLGIEIAAHDPRFVDASRAQGRELVARARGLYGEILAVDYAAGAIIVRDLYDGARLTVLGSTPEQFAQYRRWMRLFTVIVPLDDARWVFPSVLAASEHFDAVAPEALLERTREVLASLGRAEPTAPDIPVHAWFLRHAGIAYGALLHASEQASATQKPRKVYITNSDGDRVVWHDVEARIRGTVGAVGKALARASDFVTAGPKRWDWVDRSRTEIHDGGETLATLERDGTQWALHASSEARIERFCDRLEQLLGARPKVLNRVVVEPWKTQPGAVDAPGEGVDTIVLATSAEQFESEAEGLASTAKLPIESVRRRLGHHVASLGGVPRELVKSVEGRAAVEAWLRRAETNGLPPGSPDGRFLDLDPIRLELGLPTVV